MMTGRAQAQSNAAAPAGGSVLQRKCACGQHAMGGECGDCRKKRSEGVVQPKLSVGAADGEFEAQADRVADTVMSGRSVAPPRVTPLGANVPGYGVPERISTNLASLEGAGHALAERERSWFEPRFGRSFGDVRLHTHANAATMAGDLNARAFTFGRNIVFRAGEYSPGSTAGRRLLAHELTHVVQQGAASSSGLVQRSLYSDIKEKAYSGVISGVRKAKNSAMNGLRAMVPKLRPSLQNAALTMIYIAETCIEIVLAVIFGVIGIVVGFGEGIVDMVRGLGTLAYGVIKLQYDLVKGIFVGFEDFDADIDALVAAIVGLPSALKMLVDDWLVKFEKAPSERQSAMIGELTGQVLALIATYGVSVSKVGSAGRIAAGGAEVVDAAAATTAKAAGAAGAVDAAAATSAKAAGAAGTVDAAATTSGKVASSAGKASQAARPALRGLPSGGGVATATKVSTAVKTSASAAAKATAPAFEGSGALKLAPLVEEAPAVSPVRLVPPPVVAPVVAPAEKVAEVVTTTAAKGASTGTKVAVGTAVGAAAAAGKAPKPKKKKDPKDPCDALPILWPTGNLPLPQTPRELRRTNHGEREFEGIDGGEHQAALAACMADARNRPHPVDPAVYCEDLAAWFQPDLGNAPPDAHHMQPRYLNGEDAVYNLSGLETDLHHRGHVLLDNQSSMLNTPEWLACAPISGSLRYHPLGQEYYIAGEK